MSKLSEFENDEDREEKTNFEVLGIQKKMVEQERTADLRYQKLIAIIGNLQMKLEKKIEGIEKKMSEGDL